VSGTLTTTNPGSQESHDYGFPEPGSDYTVPAPGSAFAIGTAGELRAAFGPRHGIAVAADTRLIVLEDLVKFTNMTAWKKQLMDQVAELFADACAEAPGSSTLTSPGTGHPARSCRVFGSRLPTFGGRRPSNACFRHPHPACPGLAPGAS
jgi:hypothetical protein